MTGTIYALSNKGIPGLLKIGFTTRDTATRALELESTGVPYPFVVEYEAVVDSPQESEREVHHFLKQYHVRKEWFSCSLSECIHAVRTVCKNKIYYQKSRIDTEREIQNKEYNDNLKLTKIIKEHNEEISRLISEKQKILPTEYEQALNRHEEHYSLIANICGVAFFICILPDSLKSMHKANYDMFLYIFGFLMLVGGAFLVSKIVKYILLEIIFIFPTKTNYIKEHLDIFSYNINQTIRLSTVKKIQSEGLEYINSAQNFIHGKL